MAEMHFTLTSPAFAHGAFIPAGFTCDGEDVSPPLEWMNAPSATASYVLSVEDEDAPPHLRTHWVLFDIPRDVQRLEERSAGVGVPGRNDFHRPGWRGPCPPPNAGDHRYTFKLYALDVESLGLPEGAKRDEIERAIEGHVLATSAMTGRFKRRTF